MRFHKEDNHGQDIPVRIAMIITSSWLLHWFFDKNVVQGGIYSACLFMLFDPILNILCGKNLFHKGTNDFDKLWNRTPPHAEILVRLWFVCVGIGCYYYWHLIVS